MIADYIRATDVMILAAGYGKRLRPLTETVPKPMLTLCGKRLIEWNLEMIARGGFRRVIINLHYLGSQIRDFVGDGGRWGLSVDYSEEPKLLDTGGGIKQVESWMHGEQLLVVNSDIILGPDFNPEQVVSHHCSPSYSCSKRPVLTMVLRHDVESARFGEFGVDKYGNIATFLGRSYFSSASGDNPSGKAMVVDRLMYLGVQVVSRKAFSFMGAVGEVFSITRDTLPRILEAGKDVSSFIYDGYWSDLGTAQALEEASKKVPHLFGLC